MEHEDCMNAKAEAPEPIVTLAIKRLEGNVFAIDGQIKALEEKLIPVMTEALPVPEEELKNKSVDGHMGVPVAVDLRKMSIALEGYYIRLDNLLQRIEI